MNLLQECEQLLVEADKNSLRMHQVARFGRILRDAGIQLSYHNIADYGNLTDEEVERIFKWNMSAKKNAKLDFTIGSTVEAKGDYSKMLAGILWIDTHKKPGIQNVVEKSGLDADRIRQLVSAHLDDIKKEFAGFAPYWIRDTAEATQATAKRMSTADRVAIIRKAVLDIAQGRLGQVTAEQLAKWQQGAIGVGPRQIDNILSNTPELRDLDKYRANGSHYRATDKDRETAYVNGKMK